MIIEAQKQESDSGGRHALPPPPPQGWNFKKYMPNGVKTMGL